MADGNLGDLMFSLGVKDNVSQELNNIMRKFVNMEASVNKTTDSIRKLSTKLREANDLNGDGPSKEMLKMADAVDGAATKVVRLRSEIRKVSESINQIKAIPNFMKDADLMSSLNKLQGYLRTLNSIDGNKLLDGNRVQAVFSNGARSIQEANASLKAYKETAKQAEKSVEGNARAARDLASAFRQANDAASKTSGIMSDMKSLLLQGGIVYGAQQFTNSIIQTGGEIAQQHIALRNIIGDARKADELFAQTQQLALESPFKFGELNRDVKQLAAFGVEADNLYDTTKRLADVASGLGVSFERLGLAYGQVKSRSWLDGKELRQFAYAGLPLLQKITDLYNQTGKDGKNNYTTKDVRDMITKRQVSFEDVDAVIKKLTDEGGQFYNMQYVLSDTLLGRWNKLIDAWD
ncbi:MAG: tape measure protein, partial [Prevotella sp.]